MSYAKFIRKNVLQFATRQNANLKVNEAHKVLIDTNVVSLAQYTLAQEMMTFHKSNLLTRKQLRSAHFALRGKVASPYFISKNVKCKAVNHMYDLSVLRCAASEAKACENFAALASNVDITRAVKMLSTAKSAATSAVAKSSKRSKRSAVKLLAACDSATDASVETLEASAATSESAATNDDALEAIAQFEQSCEQITEDEN